MVVRASPLPFEGFVGIIVGIPEDLVGSIPTCSVMPVYATPNLARDRSSYRMRVVCICWSSPTAASSGVWLIDSTASRRPLALGVYPIVTLQDAREQRDGAKRLLAKGIDPSAQRRLDKQTAATGNTFKSVAEELLGKLEKEGRAPRTLGKLRWLLSFAYPSIGERRVAEITAPELLSVLRKVEARGRYETARRLRSTCGMVFRYAIATGRSERDPSADLRGALTSPKTNHRSAIVASNGHRSLAPGD